MRIKISLAGATLGMMAGSMLLSGYFFRHHQVTADNVLYFPRITTSHYYALGYDHALAELLWIRTISYFGEHYVGDKNYRHLAAMLESITRLDPRHHSAYYMAATILPWMADAAEESINLCIRAMIANPENGLWPYYLGLNYYLFFNNKVAARHYLQRAIEHGFANKFTVSLAARLEAETGGLEAARQWLVANISDKSDKKIRAFLTDQLRAVETEQLLRAIEELRKKMPSNIDPANQLPWLKQHIHPWPMQLPDGGEIRMDSNGLLYSSHAPRRFTLFRSSKLKSIREKEK